MPTPSAPPPGLKRSIRLGGLVLYGLGTTIGAGIYALLGVVAGHAGMAAPLAFLLASGLAALSALSFAELCARFPRAGGEAVYVEEGFGRRDLAVGVGVAVALAGVTSAATLCVGFVGYLGAWVEVPRGPAVLGVVLAIGGISAWGIRETVVAAGVMTLVEVGGLLLVVGAGAEHLSALPARAPELLWPPGPGGAAGVVSGAVVAFYAFLGFEDMVNVAEEVREVRRTMGRAIVATLAITTVLYVLLAGIGVVAVGPAELARADAPLARLYESVGGPPGLLGTIALFALLNGALIQVTKSSRVLYGVAARGGLPALLARIHPRRHTPLHATALCVGVAAGLALLFPLEELAVLTSLITLGAFALADLALVLVKRRDPHPPGVHTWPLWVPAAGFVVSLAFAAFEIAQRL